MSFDDNNYDESDEAPLPEESNNNRTFIIAVGILGGIILISIACFAAIYLFGSRGTNNAQQAEATSAALTAEAANNFIDQALTATFEASILPTATSTPSPTSVVNLATFTTTPNLAGTAFSEANTPSSAATATVAAALTQAASAQLTVIPTTTALPDTGFVDDFGVPGLVVMALAFVVVILVARRMRVSPGMR